MDVKLGFSTSSSSNHCVIIGGQVATLVDYDVDGDFDRRPFVCASRNAKKRYLGALLRNELIDFNEPMIQIVLRGFGLTSGRNDNVDHDSRFTFPRAWRSTNVDVDFVKDLKQFLLRDDVAILGGSDDSPESSGEVLLEKLNVHVDSIVQLSSRVSIEGRTVGRKDGNVWTLFSPATGARVKFTFDDITARNLPRSGVPDLVDISLTDYCEATCPWCYRDNSRAGKHTQVDLYEIAAALGNLQVFEVALGGGEPTLHPQFHEFVETLRRYGVVPSFSTRNLGWLLHPSADTTVQCIGQWAYSVHSYTEVEQLVTILKRFPEAAQKASIHFVVGAMAHWQTSAVLRAAADAQLPVTLLGYKTLGRAKTAPPYPHGQWLTNLLEKWSSEDWHQNIRLGIDTALAQELRGHSAVPEWLLPREEGDVSCFFNAVTGTIQESSWTGTPRPIHRSSQEYWRTAFQRAWQHLHDSEVPHE